MFLLLLLLSKIFFSSFKLLSLKVKFLFFDFNLLSKNNKYEITCLNNEFNFTETKEIELFQNE
jgi:hypothetical protein